MTRQALLEYIRETSETLEAARELLVEYDEVDGRVRSLLGLSPPSLPTISVAKIDGEISEAEQQITRALEGCRDICSQGLRFHVYRDDSGLVVAFGCSTPEGGWEHSCALPEALAALSRRPASPRVLQRILCPESKEGDAK
jgi:hypothetical protein